MTLLSLCERHAEVKPSFKFACQHEPDKKITLPVIDLKRDEEQPHEILPASRGDDDHLGKEHVPELHNLKLSPPAECQVDIPLTSFIKTTNDTRRDNPDPECTHEMPVSHPPWKNGDDDETKRPDTCYDSSPTSLRQLHPHSQPITTFMDGEQCDAEIPEGKRLQRKTEDIVETEPDVRREGNDKAFLEPLPLRSISDMALTQTAEEYDYELRLKKDSISSPSTCDEIVEFMVSNPNSHTKDAETCSTSRCQLDVTMDKRSRSPFRPLKRSDCVVGSSKTEAFYHSSSDGDDMAGKRESHTGATSEEKMRDRDTSGMASFHRDIPKPTITHSHSTPNFNSSNSIANNSSFCKGGDLTRTLSDFSQLDSDPGCAKEVIIPEPDGSEDILQITESRVSREQGSNDSLSKLRGYPDIPETLGTIPSGCKMQSDSGKELNKTSMSPAIDDDLAIDMSRVDPDHREASMDSSSTSLRQLELLKPGLAHSTPALVSVDSVCSSSDLDRVENGEKITANPHEIKRTYSSSVDTLVEEDIETLTTTSIQHTIFSVTNSDASHPTSSSLLTSSNESAVNQPRSVDNLSDVFDIQRDSLSASSVDAEGAWREDQSFPRPHSRVRRMYSSSDSNPDSVPDHEKCFEISDSVTEAVANNQWDAYVSECRRCSSTIEGRELERLSRSGRLPHTGFTSSESMTSMDSLPIQTAEAMPLLRRNSSRSVRQRGHSEGRTRRGIKSAFAKKAARLLNFVLGKNSRSDKNHPESQAKMKKRSLSSLLCGRSS